MDGGDQFRATALGGPPDPEPASPPDAAADHPGDWIGPYKILQLLGAGGFGVVWLAERRDAICQRVAIKVLKPGMDSRAVVARFEQERQALAVMDHPSVAKVFDAGTTGRGLPYFVMEHVAGESITAYCDRHNLTIRERLELFIPVCAAVQHAHHKGIIHRDLKPSNILVSVREGQPVPKVIDFGVAKAISHTLTEKTIFTAHGVLVGTPEYMSPEQAEMGATDIDTRADVYSLGVILYELLSGMLPFDSASLRSGGYEAIRKIIREQDPPKPSTRLSSAEAGAGVEIARKRQSEREALSRELRRELDWIPLKALRKDRTERYRTPEDLADDIRRYLKGEPLQAGPESARYRVRKFIHRHRVPALGASAVLLALLAGLASTLWMARVARIEAGNARQAEQAQRLLVQSEAAAKQEAEDRRELAERKTAEAESAKQEADRQRSVAELNAYVGSVAAAQAAIRDGDAAGAERFLALAPETQRRWEWAYLAGLADRSERTYRLGKGVLGVDVHPATNRVVACTSEGEVRLFEGTASRQLRAPDGSPVADALLSPDGRTIAWALSDQSVWLCGIGDAEPVFVRAGSAEMGTNAARFHLGFNPSGTRLAWCAAGTRPGVYDVEKRAIIVDPGALGFGAVWSWASYAGGDTLVCANGGNPSLMAFFEAAHADARWTHHSEEGILSLWIVPSRGIVVTGTSIGNVVAYALSEEPTPAALGELPSLRGGDMDPSGERIAWFQHADTAVRLSSARTTEPIGVFRGHTRQVLDVRWARDGTMLVSGDAGGSVKLWRPSAWRDQNDAKLHEGLARDLAVSSQGLVAATGQTERGRFVISFSDGKNPHLDAQRAVDLSDMPWPLAFDASGQYLVVGGTRGGVRVIGAESGKVIHSKNAPGPVRGLACAPNGSSVALTIDSRGGIAILDLPRLTVAGSIGRDEAFRHLAWSSHGLAAATTQGRVRMWANPFEDVSTEATFSCLGWSATPVLLCMCVSPSDGSIAVGWTGGCIQVRSPEGGDWTPESFATAVTSVQFSPDGKRLAAASQHNEVRLWDTESRQLVFTHRAQHGSSVTFWVPRLAFSADGQDLFALYEDGTLERFSAGATRVTDAPR